MFHQQKLYDGVYQIWYTLFFASQNKEITRIMNLLDIIGPVMVGPSSSHTAGAVKIGRVCHKLLAEKVVRADIYFHGSFLERIRRLWRGFWECRWMTRRFRTALRSQSVRDCSSHCPGSILGMCIQTLSNWNLQANQEERWR